MGMNIAEMLKGALPPSEPNSQMESLMNQLSSDESRFKEAEDNSDRNENIVLWAEIKDLEQKLQRLQTIEEENKQLKDAVIQQQQLSQAPSTNSSQESTNSKLLRTLGGLSTKISAIEALETVERLALGRVVVLPTARKSATEISLNFESGDRLLNLLARLATEFIDLRKCGKDGREAFTSNEYSATESETTLNSDLTQDKRTFYYLGKPVAMNSHLKIGVADDPKSTIRVHFYYDSENQCVVVGWCGKHLLLRGQS